MQDDDRYVDEFGSPLPRWEPKEPERRHRHTTFGAAAKAAFEDLLTVHDPFVDSLADLWPSLFPKLPARPGRFDDGKIFLYVANAATLFSLRPQLPKIRRRLMELPGAPRKIDLRLEIRK